MPYSNKYVMPLYMGGHWFVRWSKAQPYCSNCYCL